jgi:hypothetical protein
MNRSRRSVTLRAILVEGRAQSRPCEAVLNELDRIQLSEAQEILLYIAGEFETNDAVVTSICYEEGLVEICDR